MLLYVVLYNISYFGGVCALAVIELAKTPSCPARNGPGAKGIRFDTREVWMRGGLATI
jgi:hypothetical protein